MSEHYLEDGSEVQLESRLAIGLNESGACAEAVRFAEKHQTPSTAFQKCKNLGWLLWLAERGDEDGCDQPDFYQIVDSFSEGWTRAYGLQRLALQRTVRQLSRKKKAKETASQRYQRQQQEWKVEEALLVKALKDQYGPTFIEILSNIERGF